ncbi:MAG: AMP-binding protein [Phenylobacterium sp.]|uniref:AMP-binding protein n=1 Tax=Phenylobacterium sp. TaxID=1871053 RepID=UPI00271A8E83|nr:AMP-binding protein [Phenylobacterium sp.]MDO8913378.1 AMP-binding protein [Phenylobacterium sp.]MDP3101223.1 AMP-binding protein [Phenylobacterium sp.]HQT53367.1 AMP-binding protein [Phenylobacterium sp.]
MGWNSGDILDTIETVLPAAAPAFIHGERVVPWSDATRFSNNLARALIARGSAPGDKIAIYVRNRPEYLIALSAPFKARLTHVNVTDRALRSSNGKPDYPAAKACAEAGAAEAASA